MELNRYQKESQAFRRFGEFPEGMPVLAYLALGLTGEAGETADKLKKVYRDRGGKLDSDIRRALALELGDVLWYVAGLAQELGYSLDSVARSNLTKLGSRARAGAIHGDGDDR